MGTMLPTEVYASLECAADQCFGGVPPALFVGDVVLHPCVVVDFKFSGLCGGASELRGLRWKGDVR